MITTDRSSQLAKLLKKKGKILQSHLIINYLSYIPKFGFIKKQFEIPNSASNQRDIQIIDSPDSRFN